METSKYFAIAMVGAVLMGSNAWAATFTVQGQAEGNGAFCTNESSGSPVTGSCSISETTHDAEIVGRVGLGNLGISAALDGRAVFSAGASSTPIIQIGAYLTDTLDFSTQTGTFTIPVDISGSQTFNVNGPVTGLGGGFSRTSFLFGSTTLYSETIGFNGTTSEYFVRDVVGGLGITEVVLDIANGQLDFTAGFDATMQCLGMFIGTECDVSSDFFNSARFLGGTVRDSNGDIVANASVTSSSGFDYLTGSEPHDVSPVPLPASLPLILISLGGIVFVGSRRS